VIVALLVGGVLLVLLYDRIWVRPHRERWEHLVADLNGSQREAVELLRVLAEYRKGNVVHREYRQCMTAGGAAKKAYATFDEAQAFVCRKNLAGKQHAYRCPIHQWHLGSNTDLGLRQRGAA